MHLQRRSFLWFLLFPWLPLREFADDSDFVRPRLVRPGVGHSLVSLDYPRSFSNIRNGSL